MTTNEIYFRRFKKRALIESERMELLQFYGTESGKKLYDFILDSYDDMACEADSVDDFISLCIAVFNDMQADAVDEPKT